VTAPDVPGTTVPGQSNEHARRWVQTTREWRGTSPFPCTLASQAQAGASPREGEGAVWARFGLAGGLCVLKTCSATLRFSSRLSIRPRAQPNLPCLLCMVPPRGVCSLRIPQQGGAVAFDMLNYTPISTRQSPDGLLRGAVEQLPWCQSRWPQTVTVPSCHRRTNDLPMFTAAESHHDARSSAS
jgi:hypothetical protein